MPPRRPQDAPRRPQDDPKTAQDAPKMAPRRPQDDPKTRQDGPKTAPRRPQDDPKTASSPRGLQEAPKRLQETHPDYKDMHFVWEVFHFRTHAHNYKVACNMSPLGRRRGPALRASIRRRPQGGTTKASPQCQIPLGLIPQEWPLRSIRGLRPSADPFRDD